MIAVLAAHGTGILHLPQDISTWARTEDDQSEYHIFVPIKKISHEPVTVAHAEKIIDQVNITHISRCLNQYVGERGGKSITWPFKCLRISDYGIIQFQ
jgi:hypothetical protein